MSEQRILDAFRRWGHLQANLDPLDRLRPQPHPELDVSGEAAERARAVYCGSLGVEFTHMPDPDRCRWIQRRMEAVLPDGLDRSRILELLISADTLERVFQTRYIGAKRYSLEGSTALIPLLAEVLDRSAEQGAEQAVMAMSHRGRLNAMYHIVGKSGAEVFARFEDVDPRSVLGSGDVKYHIGATGVFRSRKGQPISIHLVSNPSHLDGEDLSERFKGQSSQWEDFDTDGWAVESYRIAEEYAYRTKKKGAKIKSTWKLKPPYANRALPIVENQLAKAGLRLAHLLTGISILSFTFTRKPMPLTLSCQSQIARASLRW